VIIAVINFVFLHGLYRFVFRRFALANRQISIVLEDDRIRWASAGFVGECPWSNVKQMVETRDHLFLFISKIEAVVLPRRAVASDREFHDVADFVGKHVNG
jgi:hypothetical protein